MVAIVSNKREAIRRAVLDMYTAVAGLPHARYHFPVGRAACAALDYPDELLDGLPEQAVESFAGVGYPFAAGVVRAGDHVLDVGAGSGTDTLICARLVGPSGRVTALDMTPDMRARLAAAAAAAGFSNVEVLAGEAESIPLPDASIDAVTTNGVLNLVPDKARALAEIFRVLKPGGRLQIADIALARPVAERYRQDPRMWAECVVGAVEEERYLTMLRNVGFENVERLRELDYFALSSSDETRQVARLFNAHSVTLRAAKPLSMDSKATVPPPRRAGTELSQTLAGVAVAVLAWLACAGAPPVLAALSAVGAAGIAEHAYMVPAYAVFLGFSVWLLWRSARLRAEQRPFRLALAGAVFAVAATWLALVLGPQWLALLSYAGVALVIAASVWSYRLSRHPGSCLEEMLHEAQLREQRGPRARRLMNGALLAGAAIATLYGMYWSVSAVS